MTELIVVPQPSQWSRLKTLVLDSVSSPITRRVYNLGLDEFFAWYGQEPRPGFTKATVAAWRVALEARGLGAVSINVRITAVRKLAVEAADNDDALRPEGYLDDFKLCAEVLRLFAKLDAIGDGVIDQIEIRAGIPRRMVFKAPTPVRK